MLSVMDSFPLESLESLPRVYLEQNLPRQSSLLPALLLRANSVLQLQLLLLLILKVYLASTRHGHCSE